MEANGNVAVRPPLTLTRLLDGADYFAGRRLMNNRQFIIRVKYRAAYRRDEFAWYFRQYGWMHYTLPSQQRISGRRSCYPPALNGLPFHTCS